MIATWNSFWYGNNYELCDSTNLSGYI